MSTNDVIAPPPQLPILDVNDLGPYAAMTVDPHELAKLFAVNVGGAGITELKLPRIRMPQAGGEKFTVPNPSREEGTREATFQGVILDIRDIRAYWSTPFGEDSSTPPQCHSNDCITGIGDPGGPCGTDREPICPLAAFGSDEKPGGKKGRGQACKHFKQIFIARPGSDNILPEYLNAPPTALYKFETYSVTLLGMRTLLNGAVTEFGLVREKGNAGSYFRLSFRAVAKLSPEAKDRFEKYARMMSILWHGQHSKKGLTGVDLMSIAAPAQAEVNPNG